MILTSKINAKRIQHCLPCIEFNNEIINYSYEERLLGVIIDRTLAWDKHIDVVLKKCYSLLYLISRIKPFILIPMRKLFFHTYILPHLDYCCIIWGNYNLSQEEKLIRFQKRAARLILDKDYNCIEKCFNELNWLTFPEIVTFQKAVLYKLFNELSPEYLKNIHVYL